MNPAGHWLERTAELELDGTELRRLIQLATERVVRFVDMLPSQPAADVGGGAELARSLVEALPEHGTSFAALLDLLFDRVVPKGFNTAGPGYLAYIPGGGLLQAAVADYLGDAVNRYVGVWAAAPGMVQLEANVIRWFGEIVGYPPGAAGFLTSGGSLANFGAIVTARHHLLGEQFLRGTVYASDQTHRSVEKAAALAGVPAANIRVVPSDDRFRIQLPALEERIQADARAGFQPFLIVGNAGTTNTGAVDDLDALADLAGRERLWLHMDAAYGGFFMLTERGRRVMHGLARADSVTLDPHKALFLPYGTGSLLVRDGERLRRAHALTAEYLPAMQDTQDLVDFCQVSPELSRPPRGLRVWLPLKLHGAAAFRRALDEKLDLAAWATGELHALEPAIEVAAEPQLSTVAFRLRRPGMDPETLNRLNRAFLERINARNRVHLTGTMLGDRFVLRICVVSFRTHRDRMEMCLEDIRAAMRELPSE
ncbi:MAG: aminotransferase class I/II-fold pyridoxal phosphate-dependent enzyme [Gemmatimonadetes bacterium]|nr:aminotransferase class I/II-fold pyridoxal phosphate-dependent enzyme [Gemmatimonadota bacterium]